MKPFERWSVWVTTVLVVVSGTGYFVTKYLMTSADPYAVVNHPLQPLFLKVHVVASPLLLFALGLITVRHVWRHYRSGVRWSRKSGITIAVAVAPMVLTGYLIQVLTSAGWIRAMAWAHIGFGFLYAVGFGVHSWVIRRREPPEPRFCDGRRSVRSGAGSDDGDGVPDAAARNFSGPNAKDTVVRSEMARTGRRR
ncbi:MAG: hypothetical protein R3266_15795 [Gemmatimonadota bacterium]|nr:hypothetical protein [Gemmatimonadota bacterium]